MQRPSSVTIFGVLNTVFGAERIVGLCASALFFDAPVWGPPAVLSVLWSKDGAPAWLTVWLTIWFVLWAMATLVMSAGGIGLLLLKPWGRVASIVHAICAIVMLTVNLIAIAIVVILPMILRAPRVGTGRFAYIALFAVPELLGGSLRLGYPILLLIFMTRPKVVAAFKAQPDAPDMPGNAL